MTMLDNENEISIHPLIIGGMSKVFLSNLLSLVVNIFAVN